MGQEQLALVDLGLDLGKGTQSSGDPRTAVRDGQPGVHR
jgi:hypothetical protein